MRVCVATDDGIKVKIGHFGDAAHYLVYDITAEKAQLVKRVENPYRGRHEHGEREKRMGIINLVKSQGCEAIVATALGPRGREDMEEHGIKVYIVKPGTLVWDAIKQLQESLSSRTNP